jgi:ATP-dependent Lhr-like helicase
MLRAVIRHGDRRTDVSDGDIDLLLTTPESLDVLLGQHAAVLKRVRIVVLDEVHQLYGTPRGAHVISLLERLKWVIDHSKQKPLQRVALSATVGDPTALAAWLGGSDGPVDVITAAATRSISAQVAWARTDALMARKILDTLHPKQLVFVNSRARCEELASVLAHQTSAEVLVHYSDLDTGERTYVEDRFRRTDRAICVATGTLELGIDIGTIDRVVMADPAFSVQAFLQRLGRAARRETTVPVLLLAGSEVLLTHQLALLSLASRGAIEDTAYPEWYSVLAQQVLSLVSSNRRKRIYERVPHEIFDCWPWFDVDTAQQLLGGLVTAEFLEREEQLRGYRQGRNLSIVLEGWGVSSNIDGATAGLSLYHGRRRIGGASLAGFEEGDVLRYAGQYWSIASISEHGASVQPTTAVAGARPPRWAGRSVGGLSNLVSSEMRALLLSGMTPPADLDEHTTERWQRLRERVAALPRSPDAVWEYGQGGTFTYYTFAGDLDNEMFRLLLDQDGLVARRTRGWTISGVTLDARHRLSFPARSEETVHKVQREHWRGLRSWTSTGPFFDQLPPPLRQREVLSQVGQAELIERVRRPREIVRIPARIFE